MKAILLALTLAVSLALCAPARAQSIQTIQPGDSLEARRQKENSNFSLLNSRYNVLSSFNHSHANKPILDLVPSLLGSPNTFLAVNAAGNALSFFSVAAGNGITVSYNNGVVTISANAGNGITSFNGQTGATHTVVNDTNVGWNSSGNTHTFIWTGLLAGSRGGTGNGFTEFTGPAGSLKHFILPNVDNATILTNANLVTVAQGGTGAGSLTGILLGNGTGPFTTITTSAGIASAISDETGTAGGIVLSNGPSIANLVITGFGRLNAQAPLRLFDSDSSNYSGWKAPANLSADKDWLMPQSTGAANNYVLTLVDATTGETAWAAAPGSSGGEANTASNVGVGGVGLFKQKSGVDLQLRNVNAGSAKITVTLDSANNEADVDLGNVTGGTGLVVQTGTNTYTPRSIAAGSANITVTNPTGVGGNPTIDVGANVTLLGNTSTGAGAIVQATNPTNVSLNAEGTGNSVTRTANIWIDAAACQGTTASNNWDVFGTNAPTSACVTGSNVQKGVLDFPDGSVDLTIQRTISLPADWTGNVDVKFKWLSSTTTGNVVWGVSTACTGDGELDDPTFNAWNDVTDQAKATANQLNEATITNVTTSGCQAGEQLHIRIARRLSQSADTMAGTARLVGVEVTLRKSH